MPRATLIRGITVEVNSAPQGGEEDWVRVEAINNVSHAPNTIRADTRTFDDAGWESNIVAARGIALTFGGLKHIDEDTGDRPPGQELVETWAHEQGVQGLRRIRVTDQAGEVFLDFLATAEATLLGGGNDDADNWGFTVNSSGPPETTP